MLKVIEIDVIIEIDKAMGIDVKKKIKVALLDMRYNNVSRYKHRAIQ